MTSEVQTAFFSYSREDSAFAKRLAADLKAAGANVWMDQLDIEPGTPWDDAISQALHNSPRLLVILSPASAKSENVNDEVGFALSKQKHVIPVLYRECEVPFRLARLQYVDFRSDYDSGLLELTKALALAPVPAAIAVAHEQQASPPTPAPTRSASQPIRSASAAESTSNSGSAKKAALIAIPVLLVVLIAAYVLFRPSSDELEVTILAPPNFTAPHFTIDGRSYPLQGQNIKLKLKPGEHRFLFPKVGCGGSFTVAPGKTTFMPQGHVSTDCALQPVGN